jgi:hypothetical protein
MCRAPSLAWRVRFHDVVALRCSFLAMATLRDSGEYGEESSGRVMAVRVEQAFSSDAAT